MHPTEILLLIITFLDSLTVGIVVPVLSPYIMSHGGNHLILGILATGIYLCSIFSRLFIDTVFKNRGKKSIFFITSIVSFLSYLILLIPTFWTVLISRYLFTLTSCRELQCKDIAKTVNSNEDFYNLLHIFDIAGIVIGPIIGGYLYNIDNIFLFNGIYALLLLSINIFFIYVSPIEEVIETDGEDLDKFVADCRQKLENIRQINYKKDWHFLLLKFAYLSCSTIFFSKFSLLLKQNLECNIVIVGYTIAYQNIVTFGANFILPKIKIFFADASTYSCFKRSLIVFSVSLPSLYITSLFDRYLIYFGIMAVSQALVESYWLQVFDADLDLYSDFLRFLVAVFIPPLFGQMCDNNGPQAFQILGCFPIIVAIFIARNSSDTKVPDEPKGNGNSVAKVVDKVEENDNGVTEVVEQVQENTENDNSDIELKED